MNDAKKEAGRLTWRSPGPYHVRIKKAGNRYQAQCLELDFVIVADSVVRAHEIMREFIPMIGRFKDAFGLTPESNFDPLKNMVENSGMIPKGEMTGRTEAGHLVSKYKKKHPSSEENIRRCEAPIHDDKFRRPGSAGHTAWIKTLANILADEMTVHIKEVDRSGRLDRYVRFKPASPRLSDAASLRADICKEQERGDFRKREKRNESPKKKELRPYPKG